MSKSCRLWLILSLLGWALASGCRGDLANNSERDSPQSNLQESVSGGSAAISEPPGESGMASEPPIGLEVESSFVDASIIPDPQIQALIQPYMDEMHSRMDEEIGLVLAELDRGRPESALGNFVADALLWYAKQRFEGDVHLALMNNGGIRQPSLEPGSITVADIYQLLPFDNRVVLLSLTGKQVADLMRTLAVGGGEPMSGVTYQMNRDGSRVSDIRIGGKALAENETYGLVTVDYIASIGGEFEILKQAVERRDGSDYLRDAVIRYVREHQSIEPVLDGRVTYEDESM